MSMDKSMFSVSEYIQRTKVKGTPPDDKVQKPMLPSDFHLTPTCAGATTSKTTLSYDSKYLRPQPIRGQDIRKDNQIHTTKPW